VKQMNNPYLLFEFRNAEGIVESLEFLDPVYILQTDNIDEVAGTIKQLDQATDQGYYAAGFISYEAAPAFNTAMEVRPAGDLPLVWFGIFKKPQKPESVGQVESLDHASYQVSDWQISDLAQAYQEGIKKIKQVIEEGDTYQVNYTERLNAKFSGSDFAYYRQLAHNQQAGYGAYLNIGDQRILSTSPELFFQVNNGRLMTKPMKGTAARGRTLQEDKEQISWLLASKKEQAENLMIVDLLRNDMSRLAKKGSVKVAKLFEVETYPTVHQMTSTIEAELEPELSILDWFKALFPCGSITGAPKVSTMHTIAELEATPREVYCGAIGYITPDKNAVFNVPIRTVIIDSREGRARFGVGSGVTWDSTSEGEFRELQTKARMLTERRPEFQLLESLKLENGSYPLLAYHMMRFLDSAAYFNFLADWRAISAHLAMIAAKYPDGLYKVRLLLDRRGKFSIEAQKTSAITGPINCALAAEQIDSGNTFLYHKTTYRQIYKNAEELIPSDAFSVLLWNEKKELTEFLIGNLVMEKDGKFFTPPVSCGLLPGTLRQQLLETGKIQEKIILKDKLVDYDAIWFINSIRGWLQVEMI